MLPVARLRRRRLIPGSAGAALAALLALWIDTPSPALAHDPPTALALHFHPERPELAVVFTNRGLLLTVDGGQRWRLLCREALGLPAVGALVLHYRRAGDLLMSPGEDLLRGGVDGCDWKRTGGDSPISLFSLAADPGDPRRLWGVGLRASTGRAGIFRSEDEGDSWLEVESLPEQSYLSRILSSPSDGRRLYASGARVERPARGAGTETDAAVSASIAHLVRTSADGGATWREQVIPLGPEERSLLLLAVHPADSSTLFARVVSSSAPGARDRLIVSRDAAATWMDLLVEERLEAFAVAADGKNLFAAGRRGLFRSSDGGAHFDLVNPGVSARCLVLRGDALWACGSGEGDGDDAGLALSTDGGTTFTRRLRFTEVREPVLCGPSRLGDRACGEPWLDWSRELLASPAPTPPSPSPADAGTTIAPVRGPASRAPSCQASDVSQIPGTDSETPRLWGVFALAFALLLLSRPSRMADRRTLFAARLIRPKSDSRSTA